MSCTATVCTVVMYLVSCASTLLLDWAAMELAIKLRCGNLSERHEARATCNRNYFTVTCLHEVKRIVGARSNLIAEGVKLYELYFIVLDRRLPECATVSPAFCLCGELAYVYF